MMVTSVVLRRGAIVGLLCLVLAGCGRVSLYTQLGEQQANEMIALLMSSQIDAGKVLADDKTWTVTIAKADMPRAIEVLHSGGYPRERYQSMGDIFKKESFVSSQLEERARYLYGLSQGLERTMSEIDGVLVSRVHIALPEKDPLSDKIRPSSASVFIKHRPEASLLKHVADIRALVVNSVEGLPVENVTVMLFPAENWPVKHTPAAAGAVPERNSTIYALAGIAGTLLVLGILYATYRFGPGVWALLRRVFGKGASPRAAVNGRGAASA